MSSDEDTERAEEDEWHQAAEDDEEADGIKEEDDEEEEEFVPSRETSTRTAPSSVTKFASATKKRVAGASSKQRLAKILRLR
ncbi:hypothetical protein Ciccas_005878 [Cichlidogyrus casuarinus]|uniref:Uncharacterized protein n=1 Tax=Cichlidogyrus casuarinus TaxID=1844966 RepID=A0ABD2Q8I1_9PLAT